MCTYEFKYIYRHDKRFRSMRIHTLTLYYNHIPRSHPNQSLMGWTKGPRCFIFFNFCIRISIFLQERTIIQITRDIILRDKNSLLNHDSLFRDVQ